MPVTLSYSDLVPKFLNFWQAAAQAEEESERWRLWQERYDFAAVPPTEFGSELARRLLNEAWPRYAAVIELLPAAVTRLQAAAPPTAERVANLFELDRTVPVRLVSFVGAFEANAFAAGSSLCMPVEREMPAHILAHELIHQVHAALAGTDGGWRRPVGFLLLEEGLAMRGTRALYPGIPAAEHLTHDPAWIQACEARHEQILSGALRYLSLDDDQSLQRFTMQEGPAGLIREGYWAGWHAVGQLRAEGWSLGRLARVPEAEAPALVEGALRRALGC